MDRPSSDHKSVVSLMLNGEPASLSVSTHDTLLGSLRAAGLTSVREACGVGICGSCTVLVDGKAISSCITLTALCSERHVVTSEGLVKSNGDLDDVQQAFVDKHAFQCSYCIPGMIMAVRALVDDAQAGPVDAREYLSGNLCRCGTYPQILDAVSELLEARGLSLEVAEGGVDAS